MFFEKSLGILTLLLVFNNRKSATLLMHGNSNSTNMISTGQHFNLTEMMQILQNQTAELRSLKQQTESDRSTIQMLQNQTAQLQDLKQQTESDRSTIQLLQNRMFFLEAELKNLNTSSDEHGKNVTKHLNNVVNNLESLKLEMRYTGRSLLDVSSKTEHLNTTLLKIFNDGMLDVHSKTEQLNATLSRVFNDRMSGISEQIANISRKVAFTASVSSSDRSWNSGTLVFPVIITNLGNGYNPSNGIFTAPTNGNYVFFVNVQSCYSQTIYADIVLNGSTKVRTMAYHGGGDYYDAGPNLVVLTLQKGDRVWVKHYYGAGYYTNGHLTTFSGFLI